MWHVKFGAIASVSDVHQSATFNLMRSHRNESNVWVSGNVQKSIERARGEYVAFFSDDDIPPPGFFQAISERLHARKPTILYVDHKLMTDEVTCESIAGLTSSFTKEYEEGASYIYEADLGFISALTLRRNEALKFLYEIVPGEDCGAFLEIAFHMALTCKGPFIYDKTICVLAGRDEGGAPILIAGCVNIAKLYKTLAAKHLIPQSLVDRFITRQLLRSVPKNTLHTRSKGMPRWECSVKEMTSCYGKYWPFYVLVLPIYLIPRWFCRWAYALRNRLKGRLKSIR